ncbi:MAG: ABC transporter ATP-binding protein [Aigarchaeota archaeon]|nr:ABC transporter ATP-binding protein [Aigarchaeota archaeon]MDH5703869.1 ABC transporter ATP-binding protein [Aigarchaeota archaeon]
MLLEVNDLKKYFPVQKSFLDRVLTAKEEFVRAVDGVSFSLERGEILGLVGESGSGKTTTGRLCIGLIPPTSGKIVYDGVDLSAIKEEDMRRLRRRMQLVFQDPTAALNPRIRVGNAIKDALRFQEIGTLAERKQRVQEILERVGLSPWSNFFDRYPHQLSGGQRQRVVFARALVLNPDLVVADEPVAMVDVSVRAQILELMLALRKEYTLAYLYITHDLATAEYVCDRIAIMYLGKIFEIGGKQQVFRHPRHPYTLSLLSSIPVPDPTAKLKRFIPRGEIPSPINPPSGCRFHPRCPFAQKVCSEQEPRLDEIEKNHLVACYFPR